MKLKLQYGVLCLLIGCYRYPQPDTREQLIQFLFIAEEQYDANWLDTLLTDDARIYTPGLVLDKKGWLDDFKQSRRTEYRPYAPAYHRIVSLTQKDDGVDCYVKTSIAGEEKISHMRFTFQGSRISKIAYLRE